MDILSIRKGLQTNYNRAISNYNKQEYDGFFQAIRSAIEWLCQFMIEDMISSEKLAEDLIEGNKTLIVEKGYRTLVDCEVEPQSSEWIRLAKDVFFYSKQDSFINSAIKADMEGHFKILSSVYALGNACIHASHQSKNITTQAHAYAPMFAAMFDSFRSNGILSKPALTFIDGLDKIETTNKQVVTQMSKKLEEEEARRKEIEQEKQDALAKAEAAKRERDEMQERLLRMQEELKQTKAEKAKTEAKNESLNEQLSSASEGYELSSARLENLEKMVAELKGALSNVNEDKQPVNDNEEIIEEEVSLDNLFDMPEEEEEVTPESLFDKKEGYISEESSSETLKEPTDRKLKRAKSLVEKGYTPAEIMAVTRWRPINTYERLCKLVKGGYFDYNRFIPENIENIITESIEELGSDAGVDEIWHNCKKSVNKWQVKMILDYYESIDFHVPAPDNSQEKFEQFVTSKFLLDKRKCMKQLLSLRSLKWPEIIIELTAYRQKTVFGVGVWYENDIDEFSLGWDYLKAYRDYEKGINGMVYLVLGAGGKPDSPKELYLIPIKAFKKDKVLSKKELKVYKTKKTTGSFKYDPSTHKLTLN